MSDPVDQALQSRFIIRHLHFHEVDSTNSVARQLAESGAAEGTLVTAETQLHGRGQRGRIWLSPPGKGLYYSVVLRPDLPSDRLLLMTLTAGIAVSETIRRGYGLMPQLKWPNDLLLEGRKVGGILTEASWLGNRLTYVVVGIGLNLDWQDHEFPGEFVFPAGAIHRYSPHRLTADQLAGILSDHLDVWYRRLIYGSPSEITGHWLSRSPMPGRTITIDQGGEERIGIALGLTEQGFLLLDRGDGKIETITAGTVRFLS
jgi:BirA family transcriptional regulator, biotin operon repressor / biotin---[acetyl-CoA-carboxylase] ligase